MSQKQTSGEDVTVQSELAKAEALRKSGKGWFAQFPLKRAIAILETSEPNSKNLAEAYLKLCFIFFAVKTAKGARKASNQQSAVGWYEKAISVWERNGDVASLAGNLSNLGSLYHRYGDFEKSLACNLRGLELEKTRPALDDESVAAWNHVAGAYLALGRLDEAEATIKDGLLHIGEDTPNAGYLWATLADVLEARAAKLRTRAKELLPPESCSIG